tara:strand:+ start:1062 stop:1514 length:453 start_codon:yes stop_codon:yes gene_type:complete
MNLTEQKLTQLIEEELEDILNESGEAERLVGFKIKTDERGFPERIPDGLFAEKARKYIANNKETMSKTEKDLLSNAVRNRLVKAQLPEDDPVAMDLKGLLRWLDPDKGRRDAYRSSIEAERRALSAKYDEMGVGKYDQERPYKIRKQYKE